MKGLLGPLWLATVGLTLGCAGTPAPFPPLSSPEALPNTDDVSSVLFLVGDPGEALPGRSPILARVSDEVASLRSEYPELPIRVAYLGDLIYPWGLRPRAMDGHVADSLRLHAQLAPEAAGADLLFVPGNHDWGNQIGRTGEVRLMELQNRIDQWSRSGLSVQLLPRDASLGPARVVLDDGVQALILDTQAWLAAPDAERAAAQNRLAEELNREGWRSILMAHHPLRTGGSHGLRPFTDPVALLSRAGAVVQDLPSAAYSRLKDELENTFARSTRPLLFAAGHDHNLQLFRSGPGDRGAEWALVSGSGSKLNEVYDAPGMLFGGSWPGFGALWTLQDGRVVLTVTAGDARYLTCGSPATESGRSCLEAGADSFRVIWGRTLSEPPRSPRP